MARNGTSLVGCQVPAVLQLRAADRGDIRADRGFYTAPAISPDGSTVYVVYNAFTTPYQTNTSSPRDLVGVVKQGTVNSGVTGSWSTLNRGATGDARGSALTP